jgi:hypothetical protein
MTITTCATCGNAIRYGGVDEYGEVWCDARDRSVCPEGEWHKPEVVATGALNLTA